MIKDISCLGFRGFSSKQKLNLAIPNGKRGSGLTILIGPNGGGKSTLVECFSKLSSNTVSFTEGKRNKMAGDKVFLSVTDANDDVFEIETVSSGGSETQKKGPRVLPKIYYLPARRVFNPFFGKTQWSRDEFISNPEQTQFRANVSNHFTYRLFSALANSKEFNKVFWRVLGQKVEWTIDQNDSNQYYVKINKTNGSIHNSDGLGEGIVSLLFLCDAIYDAAPGETIVVDEPELSLHPQLQTRLLNEILEFTKKEQIIISTHSPIMLSIEAAMNGGVIARVFENESGSIISSIDDKCKEYFRSFTSDVNNPHVMGNDARACLFTDDGLVLTEGQEDVILFPELISQIGIDVNIPFYGFGAGGAEKIIKITYILHKLGFNKIGAIFDGDKKSEFDKFTREYEKMGYKAWILPAPDIRDKDLISRAEKKGIMNRDRSIKNEYIDSMKSIINEINEFVPKNNLE